MTKSCTSIHFLDQFTTQFYIPEYKPGAKTGRNSSLMRLLVLATVRGGVGR